MCCPLSNFGNLRKRNEYEKKYRIFRRKTFLVGAFLRLFHTNIAWLITSAYVRQRFAGGDGWDVSCVDVESVTCAPSAASSPVKRPLTRPPMVDTANSITISSLYTGWQSRQKRVCDCYNAKHLSARKVHVSARALQHNSSGHFQLSSRTATS